MKRLLLIPLLALTLLADSHPPQITLDGPELTVLFWTESGKTYVIESSVDLVTWVSASPPLPGTDGYTGIVVFASGTAKFFRLVQL